MSHNRCESCRDDSSYAREYKDTVFNGEIVASVYLCKYCAVATAGFMGTEECTNLVRMLRVLETTILESIEDVASNVETIERRYR